jgi:23S rRNA (cytosine1962-C5)-methyltransferase
MNPSSLPAILASRRKFFTTCEAFRLSHFELDPRLTVDYYAGYLLFTYYENYFHENLPALAAGFAGELQQLDLSFHGAVKKFRPENLSHAGKGGFSQELAPQLLLGELPPEHFTIREFDLRFSVSFHAGFSTGLFLDIKHARQRVRRLVTSGDQVLNLFSYTGGFSIAAAKAGAARVIEVDSSAHWLNWAQENQRLNEVTVVRQRREDAVKFLRKQKKASFDWIICDPPTYSSQKSGARFSVARSFRDMLEDLERVLRPGGHLLASTNFRDLTRRHFLQIFKQKFALIEEIPVSADFPGDEYLKIGLFRKPSNSKY